MVPEEPQGTTGYRRNQKVQQNTTGAAGNFMNYTGYHMNYRILKDLKSIPHAPQRATKATAYHWNYRSTKTTLGTKNTTEYHNSYSIPQDNTATRLI